jgi:hypothetical protein
VLLVAELVVVGALVVVVDVVVGVLGDVLVLVDVGAEVVVAEEVVVLWAQSFVATRESAEEACWRLATSLELTPWPERFSTALENPVSPALAWLHCPELTAWEIWLSWSFRLPA